jgi:3-(3-hydroxy-phenyl)propionate hydroxylase
VENSRALVLIGTQRTSGGQPSASVVTLSGFYNTMGNPGMTQAPLPSMGDNQAPAIIVGCGPTGATAALELSHFNIPSIVLDAGFERPQGSRAIAIHRTALAVWEKLGCAGPMLDRGLAWRTRKTFHRHKELQTQAVSSLSPGELPAFLNLSQHETERILLERMASSPLIDLRWGHAVTGVHQDRASVTVTVSTPGGESHVKGGYLLACDGARSAVRKLTGLDFPGTTFPDRFLIADIRADLPFPLEPRFFFDHPANPGHNILIHPQPGGVWRIDWQLSGDADVAVERSPSAMDARIRAVIGDVPYELVWLSDYRFHQRLLRRLRHGRLFFLGDAAHLVSPFGARGMNGAIHDVENLCWKLAYVLDGRAPESLLETYQTERWAAQRHNQEVTTATMRFMAPRTRWQRLRRHVILRLRLRRWVDSGKMSEPFTYTRSPILVPDNGPAWRGAPKLGSKVILADPMLRRRFGHGFVALYFTGETPASGKATEVIQMPPQSPLGKLFAASTATLYLIRPDGHIAARRRHARLDDLPELIARAVGEPLPHTLHQHAHVARDVDHSEPLPQPLGGGVGR